MKRIILFSAIVATATFNKQATAQITSPAPYCLATFDDDPFPVDDAIVSVSFGTLNNVSTTQYAAPHYVFYNNLAVPDFVIGSTTNKLKVVFDVKGGCGYGVWIDFNQNNTFEASERVAGSAKDTSLDFGSTTTITKNVTIPSYAITGKTRMRVRIVEDDNYTLGANGYAIPPCNASTSATDVMDWGETEDYTINLKAPVSVNEVSLANDIIVYPNPVATMLNVKLSTKNAIDYKIVNIGGQAIQSGVLSPNAAQINVATLAEGIYFLQLFENNIAIGQQQFVKTQGN